MGQRAIDGALACKFDPHDYHWECRNQLHVDGGDEEPF